MQPAARNVGHTHGLSAAEERGTGMLLLVHDAAAQSAKALRRPPRTVVVLQSHGSPTRTAAAAVLCRYLVCQQHSASTSESTAPSTASAAASCPEPCAAQHPTSVASQTPHRLPAWHDVRLLHLTLRQHCVRLLPLRRIMLILAPAGQCIQLSRSNWTLQSVVSFKRHSESGQAIATRQPKKSLTILNYITSHKIAIRRTNLCIQLSPNQSQPLC